MKHSCWSLQYFFSTTPEPDLKYVAKKLGCHKSHLHYYVYRAPGRMNINESNRCFLHNGGKLHASWDCVDSSSGYVISQCAVLAIIWQRRRRQKYYRTNNKSIALFSQHEHKFASQMFPCRKGQQLSSSLCGQIICCTKRSNWAWAEEGGSYGCWCRWKCIYRLSNIMKSSLAPYAAGALGL